MRRILANDGIHPEAQHLLEEAGFEVITQKVPQSELAGVIGNFDAAIVRSATKITADVLADSGKLKILGRAGVGLDNIDTEAAKQAGIEVFNTPSASSKAVASLVIAMISGIARNLHLAARTMPVKGATHFSELKKQYACGMELEGKKLGIIGFGRIGQELGKMAVGLNMEILPYDAYFKPDTLACEFAGKKVKIQLKVLSFEDVISEADIISVHVPAQKGSALITAEEISKMKDGVILINTARGGIIDETALLAALNSGKVMAAGLDVFVNEPTPDAALLAHPSVFATPHTGAETAEAQKRIGQALAGRIIDFFEM